MKKIKREWKTLNSKIVYQNPWMKVYEDKLLNPEGKEGIYGYTVKPDAVFIIAMDKESIFLLKEYRYVIKKSILNIPAGAVENKNFLENAKRELIEETGITAKKWVKLGNFFASPGSSIHKIHVFLATDLDTSKIMIEQEDDESILEIAKIKIKDLKKKIIEGKIECGISLGALSLFLSYLDLNASVIR
jgi:8-oxo-dGTP pyrophosphatase MutT (NUDIX family)